MTKCHRVLLFHPIAWHSKYMEGNHPLNHLTKTTMKITYVAHTPYFTVSGHGDAKKNPVGTVVKEADWKRMAPTKRAKFNRVEVETKRARYTKKEVKSLYTLYLQTFMSDGTDNTWEVTRRFMVTNPTTKHSEASVRMAASQIRVLDSMVNTVTELAMSDSTRQIGRDIDSTRFA